MIDKLQFTKQMKDVVLYHHNPEYGPEADRMHWIVSLANQLAHNIYDNKMISLDVYLEHFKFSDEELADFIKKSQVEIEQYRALI